MLDETTPAEESATTSAPEIGGESTTEAAAKPAKKAAAKKAPAKKAAAKKAPAKRATKKVAAAEPAAEASAVEAPGAEAAAVEATDAPVKKAAARRPRKTAAQKAAEAAEAEAAQAVEAPVEAVAAEQAPEAEVKPVKKATRKRAAKKVAAPADSTEAVAPATEAAVEEAAPAADAEVKPVKKATRKRAAKKVAAEVPAEAVATVDETPAETAEVADVDATGTLPLFQTPEPAKKPARRTRKTAAQRAAEAAAAEEEAARLAAEAEAAEAETEAVEGEVEGAEETPAAETTADEADDATAENEDETDGEESDEDGAPARRRRRRGGRRRRKSSGQGDSDSDDSDESAEGDAAESGDENAAEAEAMGESDDESGDSDGDSGASSSRRRRRRRRAGDSDGGANDDPENTVVRVRDTRKAEDQITAVTGSTRLEAKKQRRREGREAGRRRAPIVSEAEFLARREAVDRVMVIRQKPDLTQIAVLEDKVLVEHYVARESQTSLIGNVYLGRVQNVLPSMEAAFVDIGKGRNAVLYAGEVNWSALGHREGQPRKIEAFLSPGQTVLVQVTKDPIGHKGARLTSQVSLAGRFLVYVPDGTTSGISRKLPDTERARLKALLKEIVPDSAGVIVRTAAEGASEDELTSDVERLKARWEDIEAKKTRGNGPTLLYGEPDLTLKVVRDLFTEDFSKLVVEGDDAWETVSGYVEHVAPDLAERLERYAPADAASAAQGDVFSVYRIDEQIAKGLDRKVWLPSGGSLIIDRTEAMTVVDVNTGKFTGSGGNLEETVTKNNLEAAEEIVRQLRLRDIGGIIVVDFIDMVLESNRDLVLRRMVECLGRDRTRHQVAEVTSLGLVQMTRKRIGTGLLEAFSTDCEHCHGRGVVTHAHPVDPKSGGNEDEGRRGRRNRGKGDKGESQAKQSEAKAPEKQAEPKQAEPKQSEPKQAEPAQAESEAAGSSDQAPAEQGEQRTGRRRNRGRNRGERQAAAESTEAAEPTESSADAENTESPASPVADASVAAPEAAAPVVVSAEPVVEEAEEVAQAPAEVEAPKVVTRTRTRRGASRPATTTTTVTPTPVVVELPTAVPTAAGPVDGEESRPKVMTRTRGRGSRTASSSAAEPQAPASIEGDQSTAEAGPEAADVAHVPVKKGARKR